MLRMPAPVAAVMILELVLELYAISYPIALLRALVFSLPSVESARLARKYFVRWVRGNLRVGDIICTGAMTGARGKAYDGPPRDGEGPRTPGYQGRGGNFLGGSRPWQDGSSKKKKKSKKDKKKRQSSSSSSSSYSYLFLLILTYAYLFLLILT